MKRLTWAEQARPLRIAVAVAALVAIQGCSAFRFSIPDEFKDKKQVEDPPLSLIPHDGEGPCAA